MKQLLIGPRLHRDGVTKGGATILFENWVSYCDVHGCEYVVVDSNKANYGNAIFAVCSMIFKIFRQAPKCDVLFLHGSNSGYFLLAPIVALVAMLFNKPFFLKKFGGDCDKEFCEAPVPKRVGVRWAMRRASGLFFEVKRLIPFGRQFNENCYWCPNTRVRPKRHRDLDEPYSKRKFVFMSHVRKEKGVDEMLEAFRRLGPEYELDIYGTLMDYTPEQLEGRYKGVVEPDKVPEVLGKYLLLLLSSWKEGYPGIIIEAFGCGLPVIASKAGGIPEMVEDGHNGVLCDVQSADSLVEAIKRIEKMDLSTLSRNALASFDTYDGEKVNASVIEILKTSLGSLRNQNSTL